METIAASVAADAPQNEPLDPVRRTVVAEMLGPGARIRAASGAAVFGAPVFVGDIDRGTEHFRILGSFGPGCEALELSAMDLINPERLVSHHEQLMSLPFVLAERPVAALLLGIAGGAMWRFVHHYLPDCVTTLVDNDADIVALARRWFYLDRPVEIEDGERFLAGTTAKFDAIIVDLNGGDGPAPLGPGFWTDCLRVLAPGGCMATNWADLGTGRARPMAEAQVAAARRHGCDCFFVAKGSHANAVQYVVTDGPGPDALAAALARFADARGLPAEMHRMLDGCAVSREFPESA